jgi:CRISPR/Cas system-associated protein Cas10 (large subunit of type III CRISPR-Cas system)
MNITDDLAELVKLLNEDELEQVIKDGEEEGIEALVQQLNEADEDDVKYRKHKFRGNMQEWISKKSRGNGSSIIKVHIVHVVHIYFVSMRLSET